MEAPWPLGIVTKLHQSWGRGCKIRKKEKKKNTLHLKLNEMKEKILGYE